MEALIDKPELLARLCAKTDAALGREALTERLASLAPGNELNWVMTRGHWHRLGGVVDEDYQPICENIIHWAERESGGDVDVLLAAYFDAGYFATRLAGKTHFFTLPWGKNAEDFIQLEIEELQEVIDRPLIDRDWFPDSLEEFFDPLDYPRLEPEPIGKPYYQFRRITPIAKLMNGAQRESRALYNLRRFFQDWNQSSAHDGEPFCRHWVLALREYMDSDGEYRLNARPVCTFAEKLPDCPPGATIHGAELANAIHDYDRLLGFPFAWYFIMLSRKAGNYQLAEAVLRDQMGAYDYLPAKDLKVLRQWEERPYAV